jgi:hypothetical protein
MSRIFRDAIRDVTHNKSLQEYPHYWKTVQSRLSSRSDRYSFKNKQWSRTQKLARRRQRQKYRAINRTTRISLLKTNVETLTQQLQAYKEITLHLSNPQNDQIIWQSLTSPDDPNDDKRLFIRWDSNPMILSNEWSVFLQVIKTLGSSPEPTPVKYNVFLRLSHVPTAEKRPTSSIFDFWHQMETITIHHLDKVYTLNDDGTFFDVFHMSREEHKIHCLANEQPSSMKPLGYHLTTIPWVLDNFNPNSITVVNFTWSPKETVQIATAATSSYINNHDSDLDRPDQSSQ